MPLPRSPYSTLETLGFVRRMFFPPRAEAGRVLSGELRLSSRTPAYHLGFVGDVMPLMWRDVQFSPEIEAFFSRCEVVVGNLEGIVTERAWVPFLQRHLPSIFSRLGRVVPLERWVLSVANNHAGDYGPEEFARTYAEIERAGARFVGSAERPRIELVPGVTLGAWTEWSNRPIAGVATRDPGALVQAGLQIAYPHWGFELERSPRAAQRARLPAGYGAVIGHHSHLPQAIEAIDGRLVAWSLGNFVTEVKLRGMGEGLLLELAVDREGVIGARWQRIELDRRDRRWCEVRPAKG